MRELKIIDRNKITERYDALVKMRRITPENDFIIGEMHGLQNVLSGFYLKAGTDEIDSDKIQRQCDGLKHLQIAQENEFARGEFCALRDIQTESYLKSQQEKKYAIFKIQNNVSINELVEGQILYKKQANDAEVTMCSVLSVKHETINDTPNTFVKINMNDGIYLYGGTATINNFESTNAHGELFYSYEEAVNQKSNSGFLGADGKPVDNDLQSAALFTDHTAKAAGIDITNESKYIRIPLSQEMLDEMPYELTDTAPDIKNITNAENAHDVVDANPDMDFVVLTEYGFYDEKYNSSTNTSRPKIRSFELDYANLYNKNNMKDWILDGNVAVIPISKIQQDALQQNHDFSKETEPYGFFFEPIGETQKKESENLMNLDTALADLEEKAPETELI